jgi:hypothetical protein
MNKNTLARHDAQDQLQKATRMGNALKFDLTRLPAEAKNEKGSRFVGIFLMFFATFWGGMPTLMVIKSISSGEFEPEMFFVLIFTIIGTALFLTGLWLLTRTVKTTIHHDRIEQSSRSIFGSKYWNENISNYPGIVYRSEYHSGGKNQSSYTLYIVELHHPDKKKRIKLYSSKSDHGVRKIWEDCCRNLNMPALQADGNEMQERATEDLDKSVKELASEGKLSVAFDPSAPPPPGIQLTPKQDTLRIEIHASPMPIWGALIALGIPSVFIYLGFFGPAPFIFGIFGAVFMAIFAWSMLWSVFTHEVIELNPNTIRLLRTSKHGDKLKHEIDGTSVESVSVGDDGNGQQKTVRIQTDMMTHKVGAGLKHDALSWLRDCILAVLTR